MELALSHLAEAFKLTNCYYYLHLIVSLLNDWMTHGLSDSVSKEPM